MGLSPDGLRLVVASKDGKTMSESVRTSRDEPFSSLPSVASFASALTRSAGLDISIAE